MPRQCHAGISLQGLQEDTSDSDDVEELAPSFVEASLGAQEHFNGKGAVNEGDGSDESGSGTSEEAESSESRDDEDAAGTLQTAAEALSAPLQTQAG